MSRHKVGFLFIIRYIYVLLNYVFSIQLAKIRKSKVHKIKPAPRDS